MEPIKIVTRFLNGGTIKEYTQNFFPDRPSFHITPVDQTVSIGPVEVQIKDLKGMFFVLDFLRTGEGFAISGSFMGDNSIQIREVLLNSLITAV